MSRKKNYFKRALLALVVSMFLGGGFELQATHIVGADMTFSCQAKEWYEINLTVRRDCIFGDEEAVFEDPAYVGIFDAFGTPLNWLGSLGLVRMSLVSVEDIALNQLDCSFEGNPICVSEARYVGKVFLPFREKGYILGYQRCCRNETLNNIIDPLETGNTSFVCLTEETLNSCNSSPEFQDWPDLVICSGQPLEFNSAAIDKEGDSLSYMLYTPYAGASLATPMPIPPEGPPYDMVEYANGYSLSNVLGSGTPLQIDAQTGIITATPGAVGQYLVGVLVEEWRDGVSISKTRRNFEYNVRLCGNIAGLDFSVPTLQCEGLTVQVDNTSTITDQGFRWNFNYPSDDPAFISTEVAPSFTYSEKGTYTIQLLSTTIMDTCNTNGILREVQVIDSKLEASFEPETLFCDSSSNTLTLSLVSTSVEPDPEKQIVATSWEIEVGGSIQFFEGPNISLELPCNPSVNVSIKVTSSDGCTAQLTKTFPTRDTMPPTVSIEFIGNPIKVCPGDSSRIVANPNPDWSYTWDPTTDLLFPDGDSDPIVTPTATRTYYVTVTDGVSIVMDSVGVELVDDILDLSIVNNSGICSDTASLTAVASNSGDVPILFDWSLDSSFTTLLGSGPNILVTVSGETIVYLRGEAEGFCGSNVPISILNNEIPGGLSIEIDSINLCESPNGSISVGSNSPDETLVVVWESSDNITSDLNSPTVNIVALQDQTELSFTFTATDSQGCHETRTITLPVLNELKVAIGVDTSVCVNGGDYYAISNISLEAVDIEWSLDPDFGSILSTEDTISVDYPEGTIIYMRGRSVTGCESNVSVRTVTNSILSEIIEDTNGINLCESNRGSVSISSADPEETLVIVWNESVNIISDLNSSSVDIVSFPGDTAVVLTYTATDSKGCSDVRIITIPVIEDFTVSIDGGAGLCTTGIFFAESNINLDSVDLEWSLTEDFSVILSTDDTIVVDLPEGTIIYLRGSSSGGCESNVAFIILNNEIPGGLSIEIDSINLCESPNGSISIGSNSPDEILVVVWESSDNITSDLNSPTVNIVALQDQTELSFTFTATDSQGCKETRTITLPVLNELKVAIGVDTSVCVNGGDYYAISNISLEAVDIEWSLDPDFGSILSTEDTISVDYPEGTIIYMRGRSVTGCESNVSVRTVTNSILSEIIEDTNGINLCESNRGSVSISSADPEETLVIVWNESVNIISDLNSSSVDIVSFPGDTAVVLTYTATDSKGCSDVRIITIPVIEDFTVSIAGGPGLCATGIFFAESNINLDSVDLEWSLTEDFSVILSTDDTIVVDLPEGTIIYLRGSSSGGCESNVAFIILNNEIPGGLSIEIDSINLCESPNGSISIGSNDPDEILVVVWESSDNITSDLNSPTVNIVALQDQTELSFTFTATDSQGCKETRTITLPVLNELKVAIGVDTSVCVNGGDYYAISNISLEAVDIEWSLDPDFGSILSTEDTISVDYPEGTIIYMRGRSVTGCESNVSVRTVTNSILSEIIEDTNGINLCESNRGSVSISSADPEETLVIVWNESVNIISDLNSSSVDIVSFPGDTAVVLTYMVTDSKGCSDVRIITIPVIEDFTVSIAGGPGLCATGIFFAESNINLDSVDLEWSLTEDFSVILSTDDTIVVDLPEGTIIYLRGSSSGGCESNVATETISSGMASLEVDAPRRICLGDTADIDLILPEGENLMVTWDPAPEIISGLTDPKVIVVGMNTGSDSLRLSYTVTDGQECTINGTVAIPYSTVIQPNPDPQIECGTFNINLSIDEIYEDGDVFWDFGEVGGEVITSTQANPTLNFGMPGVFNGMLSSTMETCNFEPIPVFFQIPDTLSIKTDKSLEQLVCEGDSLVTLCASSEGNLIIWTDQDDNLLGTGDSITVDVRTLSTVTATVSDVFGCNASLTFNVGVYIFDITIDGPPSPVCSSDPISVTANDNTNADLSYRWSSLSGVLSGDSTATAMIDPANAEDLVLIVTHNEFDCVIEIPYPITGGSSVSATISADPGTSIISGESVTLTVVTDAEGASFMWTDGNTDGVRTVSPSETTSYSVTVTDIKGCTAEASITIEVASPLCSNYFVPSAFTPNGDGNNDQLFVRSDAPLDNIDFQIIDRWGKEVFRTMNQNTGWNGQHRQIGRELEPDVYAYCLKITCNGEEIVAAGNISLIR